MPYKVALNKTSTPGLIFTLLRTKLDAEALLATNPPSANSTTKQNPPNLNPHFTRLKLLNQSYHFKFQFSESPTAM